MCILPLMGVIRRYFVVVFFFSLTQSNVVTITVTKLNIIGKYDKATYQILKLPQ